MDAKVELSCTLKTCCNMPWAPLEKMGNLVVETSDKSLFTVIKFRNLQVDTSMAQKTKKNMYFIQVKKLLNKEVTATRMIAASWSLGEGRI